MSRPEPENDGLPWSQAAANNAEPIATVLQGYLQDLSGDLLEIGSGTGQHAQYLSPRFPELRWQCSDLPENLASIQARLDRYAPNLPAAIGLDAAGDWSITHHFELIYSTNTLHIMSWPEVEAAIPRIAQHLKAGGRYIVYGPFNYHGHFSSESNARFDQWLKSIAPHQGIRDFEAVRALAEQHGLTFLADHAMPANNRVLVFQKPL